MREDSLKCVIDVDIARAETLPGAFYGSEEVHAAVCNRVLARSWQFVTDVDSVRVPGQVYPFTLLAGSLDEPLVLTRDDADHVHCLSNVCTHRGMILVEDPGVHRDSCLRCRYHGRRFEMNGRFRSMPEFERTQGFPTERDDLRPISFEQWGKLIFACAAESPLMPFADLMQDMRRRLDWLPHADFKYDASRSRDYLVKANWALYCDNYLEGFHIPFVHAGLNSVLDYGSYETHLFEWSNLQVGVSKSGEQTFALPKGSADYGRDIAAYYYWLFPNTMFNFYPWGLSINVVRPMGPSLTKVSFLTYVMDESRLDQGAGTGLDRVEREDESVVEAVQIGVRSRNYTRGRYSPTREQGVHHFHRLLVKALTTA